MTGKDTENNKVIGINDKKDEKAKHNEAPDLYKNKTFLQKIQYIKDNVTVEPLLAGLIIPSLISKFAMGNLNLDKACRVNLEFGNEVCDALIEKTSNNYSTYEKEVQKLISAIDIWKGVIATLLPCILIMFLGSWSDRTGNRKVCILLPIFGEVITSISNLVNVFFFYEIPVEITVFLETIFPAMTGGWVTMFLGVFAYISDITTEEARTFRVGLVNFCMTVGVPIGISLSGILLKLFGYYTIFTTTTILFTLILIYGIVVLKEPETLLKEKGLPVPDRSDNQKVSFFNLSHVVETVMVAFKPRSTNRRLKVLLTLFIVFIVYGPTVSEHSLFYLFVRNLLNWDMVKYSLYVSYCIVLHAIGSLFSITVLSRHFQVEDSLLCLISCISKLAGSIWIAVLTTDLELYLVPVIEILNATTFTSLRSIISKLVDKEENAKVNSLFSLTETVASLIFNPLYSWIYMNTLQFFPGTVFLISSSLLLPALIILIIFYVQIKLLQKKNCKEDKLPKDERNCEKAAEGNT